MLGDTFKDLVTQTTEGQRAKERLAVLQPIYSNVDQLQSTVDNQVQQTANIVKSARDAATQIISDVQTELSKDYMSAVDRAVATCMNDLLELRKKVAGSPDDVAAKEKNAKETAAAAVEAQAKLQALLAEWKSLAPQIQALQAALGKAKTDAQKLAPSSAPRDAYIAAKLLQSDADYCEKQSGDAQKHKMTDELDAAWTNYTSLKDKAEAAAAAFDQAKADAASNQASLKEKEQNRVKCVNDTFTMTPAPQTPTTAPTTTAPTTTAPTTTAPTTPAPPAQGGATEQTKQSDQPTQGAEGMSERYDTSTEC